MSPPVKEGVSLLLLVVVLLPVVAGRTAILSIIKETIQTPRVGSKLAIDVSIVAST